MRWLAFLAAALSCVALAEDFAGRIARVHDGDTLTLATSGKRIAIRLSGIDAPELAQPYGAQARAALASLALGREAVAHCVGRDRYGRYLCHLEVGIDDVSARLVADGHAWSYRGDADLYSLQGLARSRGLGLWAEPYPIAPWDWRRG
ncbi:MAG: thermonuclease family protein, partial [Rhodocyclaceae bacterium]|nr:thermonuclease family protein [Rhodocyclaceae bacterium]